MSNEHNSKPSFLLSTRLLLAVLLFLGVALQYAHKTDISVAIVCMVNHTALQNNTSKLSYFYEYEDVSLENPTCKFQNSSTGKDPDGPFVWSKNIQEFILASYFYGYITTQILGGWLSFKIGPKVVFLVSMFLGSIGTILVPEFSRLGYLPLIFCRFFTGAAQGVMWPTLMGTWSKWAPQQERSLLIGISNSGSQIGTIVGFSYGGYLCTNGFDGGWPAIFYIFGAAGLVWCIGWFLLTADTPEKHKFINEREKAYIINNLVEANVNSGTPWKDILTSRACIVLFVAHFTGTWGIILFLTNAPIYMKEVLKFDIKSNGLLSSIPYACVLIVIICSGFISDYLIKNEKLSRCNVRRLFNTLGLIMPSLAMAGLAFVECDKPYLGVALLTIGLAFTGCGNGGGFLVTYNDVAASHSGVVFGISNTFASTTGIFVPYFVAAVTKHQEQSEWRIVFLATSGVYLVGGLITILFGKSDLQRWATRDNYERILDE